MLFRGLPTNPSTYLAKELEKKFPGKSNQNTDLPAFVSKNDPKWKIRIKGDPNNPKNNPAKDFFEKLIPKYLGKYPYLKQLILPECPWEWIITNPLAEEELSFKPQQIGDFFLDIADLMIEVDGRSHNKKTQKAFDKNRDDILSRRRIKTVRIKTTDINNESEVFKNTISELISYLDSREELKNYQRKITNSKVIEKLKAKIK